MPQYEAAYDVKSSEHETDYGILRFFINDDEMARRDSKCRNYTTEGRRTFEIVKLISLHRIGEEFDEISLS